MEIFDDSALYGMLRFKLNTHWVEWWNCYSAFRNWSSIYHPKMRLFHENLPKTSDVYCLDCLIDCERIEKRISKDMFLCIRIAYVVIAILLRINTNKDYCTVFSSKCTLRVNLYTFAYSRKRKFYFTDFSFSSTGGRFDRIVSTTAWKVHERVVIN